MKKITYIFVTGLLLVGCASSCMTKSDDVSNKQSDVVDSLVIYKKQVDSLKSEITDLEYQLDILSDELQMREGEISYWGQKYDSCMVILKKRK